MLWQIGMGVIIVMISGEIKQFGVCPFDKNHEIDVKKLLKHIEKCKSPTKQDYRRCLFNPYHWLHFEDIAKHQEVCPNKDSAHGQMPVPEQMRKGPKRQSNHLDSSMLSEIPFINEDEEENSDIFRMGVNFQMGLLQKNQMNKMTKKRFNEKEIKGKNKNSLWEQPNFAHWYERNFGVNNFKEESRMRENYGGNVLNFIDNDF